MSLGATETLELTLPAEMAQMIRTKANLTKKPADEVVSEAIRLTVPPKLQQIKDEVQALFAALNAMSVDELLPRAQNRLNDREQQRLSELLEANGERTLSSKESAALRILIDKVQVIASEGVAARSVLARRGVKQDWELPEDFND